MPTGYTSDIYSGKEVSFRDFALNSARAFGALIDIRDDPDAPIPDKFENDDYYAKQLKKAEQKVADIHAWTDAKASKEAQSSYIRSLKQYDESVAERTALQKRYDGMIAEVNAWVPPTSEHIKLKEFMLEQLKDSIDYDCDLTYLTKPKLYTGEEYKHALLDSERKMVSYYAEKAEQEAQRAGDKTAWVKALKDSL